MELRIEQRIDAPADHVWRVLGTEFAEIDRWSTFVKTSRPLDRGEVPSGLTVAPTAPVPGRETTTKATLKEVLTGYSDEERTLTFVGLGLPPIIRLARNVQSVRADGPDRSTVVFEITFDFLGPFAVLGVVAKRRMATTFGRVLDDLKRHVEAAHRP